MDRQEGGASPPATRREPDQAAWAARLENALSIAPCVVGSGLLFMGRGGLLPFFFVIYQHLTSLSYGEIALLLNTFVFVQAVGAPLVGIYVDNSSGRRLAASALLVSAGTLGLLLTANAFLPHLSAVALLGIVLVTGRIAANKALLARSSATRLRQAISLRATLMNIGSFSGNMLATQIAAWAGYGAQVVFCIATMSVVWLFFLAQPDLLRSPGKRDQLTLRDIFAALRHRAFTADLLLLLVGLVPLGCWGTIIPKFIVDHYGGDRMISLAYATSMITVISFTYLFNYVLVERFHRLGMTPRDWPVVTLVLCGAGMLIFGLGTNRRALIGGTFVFILGEITITPCLDEAVKRHADEARRGTYYGVMQMADGLGRLVGSSLSLFVYGILRSGPHVGAYWPLMVAIFGGGGALLHQLGRRGRATMSNPP
ncbi:MFS transporter [Sorangium sp. So ce1128]